MEAAQRVSLAYLIRKGSRSWKISQNLCSVLLMKSKGSMDIEEQFSLKRLLWKMSAKATPRLLLICRSRSKWMKKFYKNFDGRGIRFFYPILRKSFPLNLSPALFLGRAPVATG